MQKALVTLNVSTQTYTRRGGGRETKWKGYLLKEVFVAVGKYKRWGMSELGPRIEPYEGNSECL